MAEYYEAHRPPLELSDSYKTPADLSISTERPLEFYKQLAEYLLERVVQHTSGNHGGIPRTCFVDTIRGLETILSHDIKQLADDDGPAQQLQFKRNIDFMFNLVSGQLYDCPRAYNISEGASAGETRARQRRKGLCQEMDRRGREDNFLERQMAGYEGVGCKDLPSCFWYPNSFWRFLTTSRRCIVGGGKTTTIWRLRETS